MSSEENINSEYLTVYYGTFAFRSLFLSGLYLDDSSIPWFPADFAQFFLVFQFLQNVLSWGSLVFLWTIEEDRVIGIFGYNNLLG
jgi:hypothetical protein